MSAQLENKSRNIDWKELRSKAKEGVDQRTRAILAGVGLDELRALLRGDPPTEKPNPRYRVHTTSFMFHIRPRYYQEAMTRFTNTFRLGYFTVFFLFMELITGLISKNFHSRMKAMISFLLLTYWNISLTTKRPFRKFAGY